MRLTFCSNILPGTGFTEHFSELQKAMPKIKQQCPWLKYLGLRLSQPMVADLLNNDLEIQAFNNWLREMELKISTVNVFPFGDFSEIGLKDKVYLPDWTSSQRMDYTINAAKVLDRLETTNVVSMSTVPLGYKEHHHSLNYSVFFGHLERTLSALAEVSSNKKFLLALEPEPDCVLECTSEVLRFFEQFRAHAGNTSDGLGLCFDTCHFAVNFEDVERSVFELHQASVPIYKFQLSSALKWQAPLGEPGYRMLKDNVYLHQMRVKTDTGKVLPFSDTPASTDELNAIMGEWRCHFHTPIFANNYHGFGSTQEQILQSLDGAASLDLQNVDFEVETYTWNVLPDGQKAPTIEDCIVRELEWVKPKVEQCHR